MRFETKVNILIIAGCSQKKLSYAAPAIELNQGQLFRSIKKLAINNNFEIKVLSGKYGLLDSDEVIEPYNQKIRNKKDISNVRKRIHAKMNQICRAYDLIIVIMGKNYRKVLEPYFEDKFIIVSDKRGIGGYLSLLSKFNKLSKEELLNELEGFRVIEKLKIQNKSSTYLGVW